MRLRKTDALFLDFDGTLTHIQDEAATVAMSAPMERAVRRAAELTGGATSLISGRDLDDLASRAPDSLTLIGNHGMRARGLEWGGAATAAPAQLVAGLEALAGNGVWVETKAAVLAIHYREAPTRGAELEARAREVVADIPGYTVEHGKCVIEAKPEAASKGKAVERAMALEPFTGRRPVMIGDDTTDEAGFAAAQRLGGHGVKVGSGPTCAHWRVSAPEDVLRLLAGMEG